MLNSRKILRFVFTLISMHLIMVATAQRTYSDNGDGTYTNPLITADFPDPDVILVRDTFYMVSTTMFTFPGVTLLRSVDLVNWEYCSHAVSRFDFSPCYDLEGCNRYAHGQWATSLRFHQGKFYLLFITLDEGGFICTSSQATGPWEIRKLPKGFYDPGLFFDEDGKIYVTHGYSRILMTELNPDFSPRTADSLVFTGTIRKGLEGMHVYRINGYYYLYGTYGGRDGIQVALRSRNIYGPYEEKVVIRDTTPGVNFGIHQGALIQTQTGEWWTVLFTDSGPFGRFPSLQPVTWEDGWPMVGQNGKAVVTFRKPGTRLQGKIRSFPLSDEFNSSALGMQWSWNHNPDPVNWSLEERKGYLRIRNGRPVKSLREARNTLTQRPFAGYEDKPVQATTRIDTRMMKNGDLAGLAMFQDPYAFVAVSRTASGDQLVMVSNGQTVDSVPLAKKSVYLQVSASNSSGIARFRYSLDNKNYKTIGTELQMRFSLKIFTGNKFCLFSYATLEPGGSADFDWFRTGQE